MQDALEVPLHLVVPEPDDTESFTLKPRSSLLIRYPHDSFVVMPAVNLNDQAAFEANEVDDVWANGLLPAKLRSCRASPRQSTPQGSLRRCLLTAKCTCSGRYTVAF